MKEKDIKNNIIFEILKYYYIDGFSQIEIASKLNITRVAVSRYLSKARKKGLIEHRIKYPKNYIFKRNNELEKKVKDQYGLKECIIISSKYDWKERLVELADELERFLQKEVEDHTHIGVGYGVTLDTVIEYLDVKEMKKVSVVPLVGGYGKLFDNKHSNNISNVLAEKFGGISYIVNIPAQVDSKAIKESILTDSTVKELYNIINRVELAVVCMGGLNKESTLYKSGQLSEDDINYLSGKGIIGDINYIFINKEGKLVPNELSDRQLMLLPPDRMKSIENVIGLVIGKKKAEILRAVLNGGYINILFCDEDAVKFLDI